MAMAKSLLGDVLLRGTDEIQVDSLNVKVVGVYFSAHWCPPCRAFTPVLKDCYNDIKENHPDLPFEIVFVSSDRDEASMTAYFADMPWLGLPFSKTDLAGNLKKMGDVQGIPKFVLINMEAGAVFETDGRGIVTREGPEGLVKFIKGHA